MAIKTRITEKFSIETPIIMGGMTGVGYGRHRFTAIRKEKAEPLRTVARSLDPDLASFDRAGDHGLGSRPNRLVKLAQRKVTPIVRT